MATREAKLEEQQETKPRTRTRTRTRTGIRTVTNTITIKRIGTRTRKTTTTTTKEETREHRQIADRVQTSWRTQCRHDAETASRQSLKRTAARLAPAARGVSTYLEGGFFFGEEPVSARKLPHAIQNTAGFHVSL